MHAVKCETYRVLRSMSLGAQLLLLQVGMVLLTVVGTGAAAGLIAEHANREAFKDRMIAIARSVAVLPSVLDALEGPHPERIIQPITQTIVKAAGLTYVVVTDTRGIRYSHPDSERIGERVSTDPSKVLAGEIEIGTQTGTLGPSWRAKLPIYDNGEIVGMVSVGILETELQAEFVAGLPGLLAAALIAVAVGVAGAAGIGWLVRRRIYGLEPDEIRAMLDTREAMLHGIREGLIAVDASDHLVVINDAAARLLGVDADDCVGLKARDVLDAELASFLASGESAETPVLSGERVLVVHGAAVRVDGQDVGRVAMLRDRTELEATLRDLSGIRNIADDLRARTHEFANSLQVISGLLETDRPDAALAFVHRFGAGGGLISQRMLHGVEDAEVAALILAKSARAQERAIALAVSPDSRLIEVDDDEDVLTIVGNLLDNAIEALDGRKGGGRIVLSLRDDEVPGRITVQVDDDGPGVPEHLREVIFEPDVSDKRPTAGKARRGIGLTIVNRVAHRLGGSASVGRSELGGAQFIVEIPHPDPEAVIEWTDAEL